MPIIAGAIVVAALVGIVLIIRYVSAGGDSRTALWCVLLGLAAMVSSILGQIASIYYTMPIGWIVIVAAAVLVTLALFVLVGKSVAWQLPRVFGTAGFVVLSLAVLTVALIAAPSGRALTPFFEARAQQIAEANDFDVLMPAGAELDTDYGLPVGEADEGGVSLGYKRFIIVERKAAGSPGYPELRDEVAAGTKPIGDVGPGSAIPGDAEYTELEVGDSPAVGVSYTAVTEEKLDNALGTDPIHILVFERDGVEVVVFSQGYMEYRPDETYTPRPPLSFDELIELAESLEPLG